MSNIRAWLYLPAGQHKIGNRRAVCGRCGRRARFSGLGGDHCASCWGQRKTDIRVTVKMLTEAYGIDEDTLTMSLGNDFGYADFKPTTQHASDLRYHPRAEALAKQIAHSSKALDGYQIHTLCRILWAMCLRAGVPLQDFPRDGHYIWHEFTVMDGRLMGWVRWGEQSEAHRMWLMQYGDALIREYASKGKDDRSRLCKQGLYLRWLLGKVNTFRLPQPRPGTHLPPPPWARRINLNHYKRSA